MNSFVRFFSIFLVASLVFLTQHSLAEIYKYKGENGRWVFSDKNPKEGKGSSVSSVSYRHRPTVDSSDISNWPNLSERLEKKYSPASLVESATLSVVKIETILGVGSGFFVSDVGHIVTNKHVVRPNTSTAWKEEEARLGEEADRYERLFESLREDKENLEIQKNDLKSYKHEVESPSSYYNPISREKYEFYVQRYNKNERGYRKAYKKTKKDHKAFQARKISLTRRSLNSSGAKKFKIIFKDGAVANARLVELSRTQDVAILKLDGYITPYLKAADETALAQGVRAYAIGSPLGQDDSMTAGIITRIGDKEVVTDATILPGNSGGPLIDEEGKVIGVNTLKFMEVSRKGSDGLGIAIPIANVIAEFGDAFVLRSQVEGKLSTK